MEPVTRMTRFCWLMSYFYVLDGPRTTGSGYAKVRNVIHGWLRREKGANLNQLSS